MPRGGKRLGAGRPAGSENRDTAAMRAALADLLEGHVETAITALSEIARNGESEAARVSASVAILDRCYGRPAQAVQLDSTPPSGPTEIRLVATSGRDALRSFLDRFNSHLSISAKAEILAASDAAAAEGG